MGKVGEYDWVYNFFEVDVVDLEKIDMYVFFDLKSLKYRYENELYKWSFYEL